MEENGGRCQVLVGCKLYDFVGDRYAEQTDDIGIGSERGEQTKKIFCATELLVCKTQQFEHKFYLSSRPRNTSVTSMRPTMSSERRVELIASACATSLG